MIRPANEGIEVWLCVEPVDFRKQITGLAHPGPGQNHRVPTRRRRPASRPVSGGLRHIDINPAQGVKRNRRNVLTRFLSSDKVRRLNRALEEHSRKGAAAKQQADIIRLLLLTGCRKSEILSLRWSEVEGNTLALADSKTGPRKVPLNAQARRIIELQPLGASTFVFPSPRQPRAFPSEGYCARPSVELLASFSIAGPAAISDFGNRPRSSTNTGEVSPCPRWRHEREGA